jgi:hypothetical protein
MRLNALTARFEKLRSLCATPRALAMGQTSPHLVATLEFYCIASRQPYVGRKLFAVNAQSPSLRGSEVNAL